MDIKNIIQHYFAADAKHPDGKRTLYHPVYKHPEFGAAVSHFDSEERLPILIDLIKSYMKDTEKQIVKILDIGCGEGYFEFRLQEEFEDRIQLTGVDSNKGSIELAHAINNENHWDIEFKLSHQMNQLIESIRPDEYDIVLLFNVLHWTSLQEGGWQNTRKWVEDLSLKVPVLLLELAGYDTAHPNRVPGDYKKYFQNIKFFIKLTEFKHFSSHEMRPFIVASNHYFYIQKRFWKIDQYRPSFHKMRRAFLSKDHLMKIVYKNMTDLTNWGEMPAENAVKEMKRELENISLNMSFTPTCIYFEETSDYFCMLLKLKHVGVSYITFDHIENNILNILENLIEAESHGLYHYDLTKTNIMEDKTHHAFMIDCGAFTQKNILSGGNQIAVFANPHTNLNSYDAFMSLIWELLTRKEDCFATQLLEGTVVPTVFFDENAHIPNNYKNFFKSFYALARDAISFSKIRELFVRYVQQNTPLTLSETEQKIYNAHYELRRNEQENIQNAILFKITEYMLKNEKIPNLQREINTLRGRIYHVLSLNPFLRKKRKYYQKKWCQYKS